MQRKKMVSASEFQLSSDMVTDKSHKFKHRNTKICLNLNSLC